MVILAVLSLLDLLTAFVLITHTSFGWFSPEIVLYHAIYVIAKGSFFALHDMASRIDIIVGVYIVLVAFNIFPYNPLTIISVVWLSQKSLFIVGGWVTRTFF